MDAGGDDDIGSYPVITGSGTRAFRAGGDIHEQREDSPHAVSQAELDARNAVRGRGSYEIGAVPQAHHRHDQRPGLRRRRRAGLLLLHMCVGCEHASFRFLAAAYGRITGTWTPAQPGGLAHRQGAALLRARGGGRGGAPHRPAQSRGAVRGAAGQDHVAGDDDRQEPARIRHGREGPAPSRSRALARGAVGERSGATPPARRDARGQGRIRPSRTSSPARAGRCSAEPDGAPTAPARPAPTIQQRSTR